MSPPVAPDAILTPGDGHLSRAESTELEVPESRAPQGTSGVSDSPALTRKSRDTALIAKVDARVKRNAQRIVDAALRAPELEGPDVKEKPESMTDREFRAAKANWLPLKQQPGFLAMALRVLESYKKAEAETSKPAPVLNATQVVVHQEFHYPTIKVER